MDDPFEITADRIFFDDVRKLYVAEGRVVVDQVNRRLKARWLAFSTETRIGVAEGEVELEDGPDRLTAEFMVFDVDSLHGMLFQGTMESGESGFKVRAKELVRTGENTFTVRDGAFTTCRCDPGERLPWEIRSQKAEIEIGGYGTIKNSTFNVLGVPVLWVPWAFFPIKSDRETGFLLPTLAFGGRGGATIGLPFFWAALPQLNVTLTPHYFVDRGYKQDVEFEYVFGERSEGRLFAAGLGHDKLIADQNDRLTPGARRVAERERWAVLWEHDQELPGEWRWQTDLKLSSDNLYSDDFIELRPYKTFRFIESTTNMARDFGASGGYGAMIGTRYADDVQGATFADQDKSILQRWAEVRADVLPGTLDGPLGVEARVDLELIHFSNLRRVDDNLSFNDGHFADVGFDGDAGTSGVEGGEGDGVFQPGEPLIDRGTRLVVHPRIARSFQLGGLAEFVPEVGWQQTLYRTDAQQFAERGLLTARGDLRGRLARDYFSPGGRAVRHILEPRLGWAYVSQRRQRQNPLFVPRGSVDQARLRTLSLENVTRNPSDRIDNVNQLVLSLGQRFYERRNRSSASRLRADLVTAVDWDFTGKGGLGNLYVEGRLFPSSQMRAHVRGAFNPETVAFEEGEIGLNFRVPGVKRLVRHARLGFNYRYRRQLPLFAESVRGSPTATGTGDTELNQIDLSGTIEFTERVRLRYLSTYSLVDDNALIRSRGFLDYVSKCRCWGLSLSVFQEREQGIGGGLEIRFIGLGERKGSLFDSGIGFGQNFQGS